MKNFVTLKGNDVFTNSLVIAEGTGNQHGSIQRRIREYEKEFQSLGKLGFEIRPLQSGQKRKVYLLNEPQATFLITLLKNTEIVVRFKLELTKQFYAMRQLLLQRQTPVWKDTRVFAKDIRKREADVIKQFVDYAISQGSTHASRYYIAFSKLADKAIGIEQGNRDIVTAEQLCRLSMVEQIIETGIRTGMQQKEPYKEIFKVCKQRVDQFRAITLN